MSAEILMFERLYAYTWFRGFVRSIKYIFDFKYKTPEALKKKRNGSRFI